MSTKIKVQFCLRMSEAVANNYPLDLEIYEEDEEFLLITEFRELTSNPFKLGDEVYITFDRLDKDKDREFYNGKTIRLIAEHKEVRDHWAEYECDEPTLEIFYTCEICTPST